VYAGLRAADMNYGDSILACSRGEADETRAIGDAGSVKTIVNDACSSINEQGIHIDFPALTSRLLNVPTPDPVRLRLVSQKNTKHKYIQNPGFF